MYNPLGVGVLILIILAGLTVSTVIMAFFAATTQKLLNRCAPQSRTMSSASVWLLLIPIFNHLWALYVVYSVTRTLKNEFSLRRMMHEPNPGLNVGMMWAGSVLVCYLPFPFLRILCLIVCFVSFIAYWIKLSGFSSQLQMLFVPMPQTGT